MRIDVQPGRKWLDLACHARKEVNLALFSLLSDLFISELFLGKGAKKGVVWGILGQNNGALGNQSIIGCSH
jgi:hypothetical protein